MEKCKRLNKCAECEHFGDGRYPVVRYFVEGRFEKRMPGKSK